MPAGRSREIGPAGRGGRIGKIEPVTPPDQAVIGEVVDAANGRTLQEVIAVESGFLFTLREHPLVYPSALLGRIARNTIT